MSLPRPLAISEVPIAANPTPFCGAHHKWPDDIAGYAVVLTRFGHGKVRDDGYFDAHCYGETVRRARELREQAHELESDWDYARIDVLYTDGCRRIL